MDARFSLTLQAKEWLEQQAKKLRENLAASEGALQAYRDRKGLIDAQTQARGGAAKQLEALTDQLVQGPLA
ncbi:MAG: hypothetical protein R3E87_22080 [Burkholderiaceae bacterium]